jgi:hypothetical protein
MSITLHAGPRIPGEPAARTGYPARVSASLLRPEPGPATLKITRWGGRRLAALRGAASGAAVGESWEFSTLPGHESRARGRPLSELLAAPLPFLAKLLDTALPLSVQVHPGDQDDAPGKEEAWVVLAADPGARVWAGLRPAVARAEFTAAVLRGAPCLDYLDAHTVEPGAVILVPARTIHAIGGGILLAEIQQPTDCTLRLHDHGSGREIHPVEALAVADLDARPEVWRPRDPPRTLQGRHVRLEILAPGRHARTFTAPTLLVPALGAVRITGDDLAEDVGPGELRLAQDGPWRLDVAPRALCVVGSVR